jgi:hypothetical protein
MMGQRRIWAARCFGRLGTSETRGDLRPCLATGVKASIEV